MNNHQTYEMYYDEDGDFLEISLGEPAEEGTTDETEPGIFITRDIKTKRVTDIGILDFKRRCHILGEIFKKMEIDFPLSIGCG